MKRIPKTNLSIKTLIAKALPMKGLFTKTMSDKVLPTKKALPVKILYVCISLFLVVSMAGFSFDRPVLILDTEKNILYENIDADEILMDFQENSKLAEDLYEDNYFAVRGIVSEKKDSNGEITIKSLEAEYNTSIVCKCDDSDVMASADEIKVGDTVEVYGRFSVDFFSKTPRLDADGVNLTDTANASVSSSASSSASSAGRIADSYSFKDGTRVYPENLKERSLKDGQITYLIPAAWQGVEHNIIDEELGVIEGYQYCLNEIKTSRSVEPESFFVFYFDNKLLKNQNDKSQTDLIEKAIIANILDKEADKLEKFPLSKVTTYYGNKYQYYQDAYVKELTGDGYHMEFVFQKDEEEGIIGFLYVYKEKTSHLKDAMLVMRFFNE